MLYANYKHLIAVLVVFLSCGGETLEIAVFAAHHSVVDIAQPQAVGQHEYQSDGEHYAVCSVCAKYGLQSREDDIWHDEYYAYDYHLHVIAFESALRCYLFVHWYCLSRVDCRLEYDEVLESHGVDGIADEHHNRHLAGKHHWQHQHERQQEHGRIEDVLGME